MNHSHRTSKQPSVILLTALVVISILAAFVPTGLATAATQYLGGYARADDLRIQMLDDGRIGVERYTNGAWDRQIYGTTSKGSRLQFSGGSLGLGYFSGGGVSLAYNNSTSSGSAGSRIWTGDARWTGSGFAVNQTVTYREGDPYFKLQWKITNNTTNPVNDLRFFHGEDTYLRLGDNGAGWVDWGNSTIGVKKIVSGTEQRMALQGVTTPYAYQSNNYSAIRSSVNGGALTNAIDANEWTDNGYALEWRNSSLGSGSTWTIIAYEKFNNANIGAVQVIAPVATDCDKGATCDLVYTVKNLTGSPVNVGLSIETALNNWSYTVAWPSGTSNPTIGGNGSVQVRVSVTVPGSAANNSSMEFKLNANPGGTPVSETAAVNALTPPNSNPTSVLINGSTGGVSINENTAANSPVGTLSGVDPDNDSLTYSLVGGDTGSFTLSGTSLRNNASFNYESKSSYSITVRASDGKGGSLDRTFAITVNNVVETPVLAQPSAQTINEDASASLTMTAAVVDNDFNRLTWTVSQLPSNGVVGGVSGSGSSKSVTYIPALNFNGVDSFKVRVSGEAGTYSEQTVNVTVNAVNDAPLNSWNGAAAFNGPLLVRVNQEVSFDDASTAHIANRISVSDVEANSLVVTLSVGKGTLVLSETNGLSGDMNGADGTLSISGTPAAVNAALKGLRYTATYVPTLQNPDSTDSLSITTNDQGATGSGGTKSDTDSLAITISNPTALIIDDDFNGAIPGWGYDHFASLEEAVAAAQSIDASNPAAQALSLQVERGNYPADSINLDNAQFTLQLAGNITLGKDFNFSAGTFTPNGHKVTFITGANDQTHHLLSGAPLFADLAVAAGNSLELAASAELALTGELNLPSADALDAVNESGRTTVRMTGVGAQTLPTGLTLDNLVIDDGAIFTAPAALSLKGSLTNNGSYASPINSLVNFAAPEGHVQTITGNAPQFHHMTLFSGAILIPSVDLTAAGNWNDQGVYVANSKKVTFTGAAQQFSGETVFADVVVDSGVLTLAASSDFGYTGSYGGTGMFDTMSNPNTTVRLAGGIIQTLPAGQDSYHHIAINLGTSLDATGRNLQVANDFSVLGRLDNTGGSVSFTGQPGTVHYLHINAGVPPQFGGLTIAAGNSLVPDESGSFNVRGNWNEQGTFTANRSTVNFNGASQSFDGETVFHNVNVNDGSTLSLLDGADFGYSGSFNVSGDFNSTTHANTTLRLAGSAPQVLHADLNTLPNLVINPGATLNAPARTLSIHGDLDNQGSFDNKGGSLTFTDNAEHTLITGPDAGLTQFGSLTIAETNLLITSCAVDSPIKVAGDWTKTGTMTANQCQVIFNGSAAQKIDGLDNRFYDLSIENTAKFPNDSADVDTVNKIVVTHNLEVISGQFQPANLSEFNAVVLGGELNSQAGILRPDRGQMLIVSGDWDRKAYGWFDANAGVVKFTGDTSTSIMGGATFYDLQVSKSTDSALLSNAPVVVENQLTTQAGTFSPSANSKFKHVTLQGESVLQPAGNINIGGNLVVNTVENYIHDEKSVTFDGSGIQNLDGAVNFYNLTVNDGSTLQMQTGAILGYAGALLLNGDLDATAHPGNTILVMGQDLDLPQTLPEVTVNDLEIANGSSLLLSGPLTVTGDMKVVSGGSFDAASNLVTFDQLAASTAPTFAGSATFANVAVAANDTLYLKDNANLAFTGSISGGPIDGVTGGTNTTLTVAGSGASQAIWPNSTINHLVIQDSAQLSGDATTLKIYGNWSQGSGTFTPGSGLIWFMGGAAQEISGMNQTFNNLMVAKDPGTTLTAGMVTVDGVITLSGGEFNPACGSTFNAINIAGGNLTLAGSGCEITVNEDWSHSSGAFNSNGATVVFDGGADTNHAIMGVNASFDGLRLGSGAALTLSDNVNLHLAGPLTLDATSSLVGDPASTLTVTGPVTSTQGLTLGNLVIEASGALTIPHVLTLRGSIQNDATVAPASCLDNDSEPACADSKTRGLYNAGGAVIFTGGGIHDVSNTLAGATRFGGLTIDAANELRQTGTIGVAGDWLNNGTYTPGAGTVVFNGVVDQSITTAGEYSEFTNVTVDNTRSDELGRVTSAQPLRIATNLSILNGILVVPDDSQLADVYVAPGAVIDLPAPGADTSVLVNGHWDNQGTISTGGTSSIQQGGGFYLESAVVDQTFLPGEPGLDFDKFTTIGPALAAAKEHVYVIGSTDATPRHYAETMMIDGVIDDLTSTTTANLNIQQNVQLDGLDILRGSVSLLDGATLHLDDFAPGAGTFDLLAGTLALTGNFSPATGVFDHGTGTVVLTGSGAQSIAAGSSFYDLTIQNTAVDPDTTPVSVDTPGAVTQIAVSHLLNVADGQFMPDAGSHFLDIQIGAEGILKLVSGVTVTVDEGGSLALDADGELYLNGGRIEGLPQSTVRVDDDWTSLTSGFGYDRFDNLPDALAAVLNALGEVEVLSGSYLGAEINKNSVNMLIEAGQTVSIIDDPAHLDEDLTVTSGTLTIAEGGSLKVAGDFSVGTSGRLADNSGSFTLNGASAQTISGLNLKFDDLTIQNGADGALVTTTLPIQSSGTLTVSDGIFVPACDSLFNNVSVAGGAELRLPDPLANPNCEISVAGTWEVASGATFTPNNGKVIFNGPDARILGSAGFASIEIAGGARLTAPAAPATISLSGAWNNLGTFVPNAGSLAFTGVGPQALGGTLNFHTISIADSSALTPSGDMTLTGDWTQAGIDDFVPGNHAVRFTGAADQTISGPEAGIGFYDLVVAQTNSAARLIANPALRYVTHLLDIASGELVLNRDSYVQNLVDQDAVAHLSAAARLTLVGSTKLNADNWASDGGTITIGDGGGLIPGKVSTVVVDKSYGVGTGIAGFGIDHFSVIAEALDKDYLAADALITVMGGEYPEDLIISKPVRMVIDGSISLNGLTIDHAGAVFTAPVATGSDLLTLTGNLNVQAGSVEAGSGVVSLAGNLNVAAGAIFDAGSGTLSFTGTGSAFSDGLTLHNLRVETDGSLVTPATFTLTGDLNGAGTLDGSASSLSLDGADGADHTLTGTTTILDVAVAEGESMTLAAGSNLILGGELALGSGATVVTASPDATLTLAKTDEAQSLPNGLTLGTLIIQHGTTLTAPANLTLTGDLVNGGTFTEGIGTVSMAGSAAQQISGGDTRFFNLVINDADDNTGANDTSADVVVDVTNRLNIADGKFTPSQCGQIEDILIGAAGEFAPPSAATCSVNVQGGWTNNGTFTKGTSRVVLNNADLEAVLGQTIGGTQPTDFYELEIDNQSNLPVSMQTGRILQASHALVITDGTLQAGADAQVGDVSIADGAGLTAPAGSLFVAGGWDNTGNFAANGGTVKFTGSGAHSLAGVTQFANLIAADGNSLSLAAGATVAISGDPVFEGNASVTGDPSSTLNLNSSGPVSLPEPTSLGGLKIGAQAIFDAPPHLALSGDFNNLGIFNPGTGRVTFTGSTPKTMAGNFTFYSLHLASSDTGLLSLAENTLITIQDEFIIPYTETTLFDGSASGARLTVAGTGTPPLPELVIIPNNMKLHDVVIGEDVWVGLGTQTWIYGDLTVNGAVNNGGHSLNFSGTPETAGDSTRIHHLSGTGSVVLGITVIDDQNTLIPDEGMEIIFEGSFVPNGTFVPNRSTVTFRGSIPSSISSDSATPVEFYNLVLDRYGATEPWTNTVTQFVPVNVTGLLDVQRGDYRPRSGSVLNDVLIRDTGHFEQYYDSVSIVGNWTDQRATGVYVGEGGTVTFTKPGTQTFSGKTRFDKLIIDPDATLVLADGADLGYASSFTIAENGHLDATGSAGTVLTVGGDGVEPHPTLPDGLTLRNLSVTPSTAVLNGADRTVTLLEDLTVDGTIIPNLNVIFGGSGEQLITGSGEVHFGNLTIGEDSTLVPGDRTLYVNDDWTDLNPAGGFTPGLGTVVFEGPGTTQPDDPAAHMISGVINPIFTNLIVRGGSAAGPVVIGSDLTVESGTAFYPENGSDFNNITLEDGATLKPELGATIKVGGNWVDDTTTGGGFDPNAGTVVFDSSADQSIGGASTPASFFNLVVSDAGTVTPGVPLVVANDLRLEQGGGMLIVPDGSVFNNVTINADATFELVDSDPAATFTLNGSWSNEGTYVSNGGGLAEGSAPEIALAVVDPVTCASTPDACGVDRFTTIQEAIDAVAAEGMVTVKYVAPDLLGTGAYIYGTSGTDTIDMPEGKPIRVVFEGSATDDFTFILHGNILHGSGTLIAPAGTLRLDGSFNHAGGSFNANDGSFIFDGSGDHTLTGVATDFYRLVIDDGDSDAATNTLDATAPVNVASSLEIIDGSFQTAQCGQYGNVTIGQFGEFAPQNGGACVKVSGSWTNDGAFANGGSTVTFNGAANQTIGGSHDTNFGGLTIDNRGDTGRVSLIDGRAVTASGQLDVLDGLFVPSNESSFGSIFIDEDAGLRPENGAQISLSGSFDNQGSFDANSGTVLLTGGMDQALDGTLDYYNLTIGKTPATASVNANSALRVANNLLVTSGNLHFATGADFNRVQIDDGGAFSPDLGVTYSIGGDWLNNGSYTPNQDTVIFDGSSAQTVTGVNHLYNLTVNNSAAPDPACDGTEACNLFYDANSVAFDQPLTVANQTTVSDGQYRPLGGTEFNHLTIGSNGRVRALANGDENTLVVGGTLNNRGLLDLNGLDADGNFTLNTLYVSSEYTVDTPGYGVDHFTGINEALGVSGLGENATITVYGGVYGTDDVPEDVIINKAVTVELKAVSGLDESVPVSVALKGSLTLAHAGATFIAPHGELSLTGSFTVTAGAFNPNQGVIHFNGDSTQHIAGELSFYDLKVTNLATPAGDDADVDADSALSVEHELLVAEGQFSPQPCSTFTNVVIETGGLLKPQAASESCSTGLSITGNWTNTGGEFAPNGSPVIINGTAPQILSGETGFDSLTIDNPDGISASGAFYASDLTITNGVLTLPDSATVENVTIGAGAGLALAPGATLTVTGDWIDSNTNGGFDAHAGTVRFAGEGEQSVSGNSTFHNLIVGPDSDFVLADGSSLGYSGAITVDPAGTLDLTGEQSETALRVIHTDDSPSPQRLPGPGDLNLDNLVVGSGAVLSGDNPPGTGQNVTLLGDFTNNGTFQGGAGQVTFVGTEPQTISGTGTVQFNDLVISGDSTLNGPTGNLTVTGDWNNQGMYNPGQGTVTFGGTANQTITGQTHFHNLVIAKLDSTGQVTVGDGSDDTDDTLNVTGSLDVTTGQFIQIQNGSFFDTINIGSAGTLAAVDNAQDIGTNHFNNNQGGTFSAPGGIFKPSNVLWADDQTDITSIPEKPAGLDLGQLMTVDLNLNPQDQFDYALVNEGDADEADCGGESDNQFFTLAAAPAGMTRVLTLLPLDFETPEDQPYRLCVRTTDPSGLSTVKIVRVTPTDANDEPVVTEDEDDGSTNNRLTVDVDEDSQLAFTLHGTDQDSDEPGVQRDTLTWQITDWPDHGPMTGPISGSQIFTGNDLALNYQPSQANWNGEDAFTAILSDGVGNPVTLQVKLNVVAVNDPPVNDAVPVLTPAADAEIGQKVQSTSGGWNDNVDSEAPGSIRVTYQWQRATSDQGDNLTDIAGAVESAYYPTAADQGGYIRAQVTAHDNGRGTPTSAETTVTSAWVFVPGTAPTGILLSHQTVAEKQPVGTLVGRLSTLDTDSGDQFTYALVGGEGGEDNDLFALDGANLVTNAVFDYQERNEYSVLVQTTDGGANVYEQSFTISIVGLRTNLEPKAEVTVTYPGSAQTPADTQIHVPYGGVLDVMTLVYVPRSSVSAVPSGQAFTNQAFNLAAYIGEEETKNYTFNKPLTVTLTYPESMVAGVKEETLSLAAWNGSSWEPAACGDVIADAQANTLSVPVCNLGEYALFGEPGYVIHLPFIFR